MRFVCFCNPNRHSRTSLLLLLSLNDSSRDVHDDHERGSYGKINKPTDDRRGAGIFQNSALVGTVERALDLGVCRTRLHRGATRCNAIQRYVLRTLSYIYLREIISAKQGLIAWRPLRSAQITRDWIFLRRIRKRRDDRCPAQRRVFLHCKGGPPLRRNN